MLRCRQWLNPQAINVLACGCAYCGRARVAWGSRPVNGRYQIFPGPASRLAELGPFSAGHLGSACPT
jgi:hypothetical protein